MSTEIGTGRVPTSQLVERFGVAERMIHWVVAVSFVGLLLSGLAFAYPSLFWLTALFGGGASARIVHDWLGLVFALSALLMAFRWASEMMLGRCDREWLGKIRYYVTHQNRRMPDCGKYNGGQKLYFWLSVVLAVVFLGTGLPLWLGGLSATTLTWMRWLHFVAAVIGGIALIGHIYLAVFAYPGTGRGMAYGKVTRSWALFHHPSWYRETHRE